MSQLLVLKLVETVDTKIVSVNLDKKSWCDVMERMEKKGIKIMSGRGECFESGGYSVRKTLARLHDKEGLYTCTPGQAFEKTTEFSTMPPRTSWGRYSRTRTTRWWKGWRWRS